MKDSKSAKNKTILFISHNLNLEGAPWSLFYTCRGLRNKGCNVKVISFGDGPLREVYEKNRIDIKIIDPNDRVQVEEIKKGVDVFFINTLEGARIFKHFDLKKDNILWCIRESDRDIHFKDKPYLKEEFFSQIKKVVFVSDETRIIYDDLLSNNYVVIHNGLDLSEIDRYISTHNKDRVKSKLGYKADDIIISIVGSVSIRKGQLEFLESAYGVIDATRNSRLKFVIVGAGTILALDEIIRQKIQYYGIEDQVQILPKTEDIFDYYYISDISVCNSYIESFPRVVLEAMAFSLPIVATSVFGIKEQLEDKKDGLLVMPGDIEALKDSIIELIEDDKLLERLGKNSRKKLEMNFTYDKMIDKFYNLIN